MLQAYCAARILMSTPTRLILWLRPSPKHHTASTLLSAECCVLLLSFTGWPLSVCHREVRVTWQTYEAGRPAVKYGLQPGNYSQVQYGTFSTYSADDLCSQPASAWGYSSPGIINTAVLQNLQPGTTYYYSYGQEVSRKLLRNAQGTCHQGFKQ